MIGTLTGTQGILSIGGGEARVDFDVSPAVVIPYCVCDASLRKVYIYLRGVGETPLEITGALLDEAPLALARSVTVTPGKVALLVGSCDGFKTPSDAPFVGVTLLVPEGRRMVRMARMFLSEHTQFQSVTGHPSCTVQCLTHDCGTPPEAAAKAVALEQANSREFTTMKFCNLDMHSHGPALYGQVMDRNFLEPQLAHAEECAGSKYVEPLVEEMEQAARQSEPGICCAWVFPSDIHSPEAPPYGVSRLRNMTYALIAGGGKGALFHQPYFPDPEGKYGQAIVRLVEEVNLIRDWIAISEPAPLVDAPSSEKFLFRTLLCGDKGIILFQLPKDDAGTVDKSPVLLSVREPRYELELQALEVGGLCRTVALRRAKPGVIEMEAQTESYAQVFVIAAKS
jgi:hypothetical protein